MTEATSLPYAATQAYEDIWQTLHLDTPTLSAPHDSTIVPKTPQFSEAFAKWHLPALVGDGLHSFQTDLELGRTLGQGGMGTVYLAQQLSLGREVAVKRLNGAKATPSSARKLLQEAWITGLLEHPNIVPIHVLGQDEHGLPMLVMKRIEGTVWLDVIHNKAPFPQHFHASDPFLEHLKILMQVCHAISFAHSKGIIHRDLKPENVMLGEFGEVYVLDWGIAVTIHPDETGRFPQALQMEGLAGTPAYMAPEMAAGWKEQIGPRTDVYLLGAILHEILTGSPPHRGDTLFATMFHAFRSEPQTYGVLVPEELGQIANQAMHKNCDERYPDVQAFRQALVEFMMHRDSRRISEESSGRLKQLHDLLNTPRPLDLETIHNIYQLSGQCRFGFQEALSIWPQNISAQKGLQATLECLIGFELEQEHTQSALSLLSLLPVARPDLQALCESQHQQHKQQHQEYQRLKQWEYEHDLDVGSQTRAQSVLWMGFLWGVFVFAGALLERNGYYQLSHRDLLLIDGIVSVLLVGIFFRYRRELLQNAANRRLVGAVVLASVGMLLLGVISSLMGLMVRDTLIFSELMLFLITAMLAVSIDWRLWAPAGIYLLALGVSLWKPHYAFESMGLANIVGFKLLANLWKRHRFFEFFRVSCETPTVIQKLRTGIQQWAVPPDSANKSTPS